MSYPTSHLVKISLPPILPSDSCLILTVSVLLNFNRFRFVHLQVPQNPSFLEQMSDVFDPSVTSAAAASSSSCPALGTEGAASTKHGGGRQRQDHPPPFLTEDEVRLWAKERQKKDNHNQSTFLSLLPVPVLHSTIVRSVYGQIMARLNVPSPSPAPSPFSIAPMVTNRFTHRLGSEPVLSINVNLTETGDGDGPFKRTF